MYLNKAVWKKSIGQGLLYLSLSLSSAEVCLVARHWCGSRHNALNILWSLLWAAAFWTWGSAAVSVMLCVLLVQEMWSWAVATLSGDLRPGLALRSLLYLMSVEMVIVGIIKVWLLHSNRDKLDTGDSAPLEERQHIFTLRLIENEFEGHESTSEEPLWETTVSVIRKLEAMNKDLETSNPFLRCKVDIPKTTKRGKISKCKTSWANGWHYQKNMVLNKVQQRTHKIQVVATVTSFKIHHANEEEIQVSL